eukprot:jgi/Ulvmu1/10655/UM066_0036.1
MKLGAGIAADLRARAPWYASDWKEGFSSGYRIFAPSVYIFFASVIPALAFGEQIEHDTHGAFNGVHVLMSTAISGIAQALIGGQPLLILGVAEPTVLMYGFMYQFADGQNFAKVFVPWCSWVCLWTALFLIIFSFSGLCQYINKFTRFSGELFGMLIAILFMQQAVKGVVQEYRISGCGDLHDIGDSLDAAEIDPAASHDACDEFSSMERLVNGLWATILALGTVLTSMTVLHARSWRFFKGGVRSLLADYGVPLMVIAWSAASYALEDATPDGVPRRLSLPNAWHADARRNWDAVPRLLDVSGLQIVYAIIPALILSLLFYFDHNVSAQLAQQKDFQLVRPPAYNWDLAVLGLLVGVSGLLGIPPPNGVIPQAPMHTKSLITLKQMLVERDGKSGSASGSEAGKNPGGSKPSSAGDLTVIPAKRASQLDLRALQASTAAAAAAVAAAGDRSSPAAAVAAGGTLAAGHGPGMTAPGAGSSRSGSTELNDRGGLHKEYVHLEGGVAELNVKEQRLSNLIQGVLVGACVGATPVVRQIPKSVLWGYFAYMALEGLPGSEFWERILLLLTDKRRRIHMLEKEHPVYLETVSFRNIARFTGMQLLYLAAVWGVTWAGAVGIAFPFLIVLLIPARQYLMPLIFDKWTLSQLDAAEYEEAPPAPEWVVAEAAAREGAKEVDEHEQREALESELPGFAGIKHHLTAEEVVRRRRSLALEERTSLGSAPGGDEGMAAVGGARGSVDEDARIELGRNKYKQ